MSLGAFDEVPRSKRAPARTRATRWGALTALQRTWADSTAAARLQPGFDQGD
ncbi:hypothetical protein AB0D14_40860 [Streptomyces sp. NPDC048484]|uniref:hypothetical protein n=1 Tax=Streptomyces sp. NPDC048484 TaxID=3155146 RepID=UPI00342AF349